jgi:hypothetical protein
MKMLQTLRRAGGSLVMTVPKVFNSRGLAGICPISQGGAAAARTYSTVVTLMGSGTDTQGEVEGSGPGGDYQ